jgi:hypothetical protein
MTKVAILPVPTHSFFDSVQQQRLADPMNRWRTARDRGQALPSDAQAELEALVDAELHASAARTEAVFDNLAR